MAAEVTDPATGPAARRRGASPTAALAAVAGHARRAAGSDAERRAAREAADALAGAGLTPRTVSHWFLARADPVLGVLGVLGGLGAGLAVEAPIVGTVLCTAVAILAVLERTPWPLARRLAGTRATQDVVASDGRTAPVRLVLVAAADAPRSGPLDRGAPARAVARLSARLGGRLPAAEGVVLVALVLVAALAAAGIRGPLDGRTGPLLLVPALAALLAGLALAARGLTRPPAAGASADASTVGVLVGVVAALRALPPRNLAVEAWVTGARHDGEPGARRLLRQRRAAGGRATDTVVVELTAAGRGRPAWTARTGLLAPRRLHRQLAACVGRAADRTGQGARAVHERRAGVAAQARRRGHPAIVVGCRDADGLRPDAGTDADAVDATDPAAVRACTSFVLAALVELDRELDGRIGPPTRRGG